MPLVMFASSRRFASLVVVRGGRGPLLVIEGIDADNKNSAATYLALGSNTRGGTQDALFPLSLGNGADVGILDFADGSRDMVYNAQVVKGAVRFFRGWRSRPDVGFGVAGVSMGGVVARRALAEMEDEQSRGLEEPHGVAHFVSLDAPQRGAVIDRDLQDDIKELSRVNSNLDVPAALRSEAGMQLLTYAPFDTATPTRHQSFFQSLRALNGGTGYPQQTDNIGVSFGTSSPNAAPQQEWVELRLPNMVVPPSYWGFCGGIVCQNRNYRITGEVAEGGSLLPKDQASQWGIVFQVFSYELDRTGRPDPTFIPYASALDLSAGTAAFDTTLSANVARYHDDVPWEIVRPLLSRMGYLTPPPPEPLAPLAVDIDGPYNVPTNPGTWTASVNRPAPNGFTYAWRYRLDLTGACDSDGGALARATSSGQRKPGTVTPNLVTQCEWYAGPAGPTFTYSIAGSAWLDIEVTAVGGSQVLTESRRVVYGSPSGDGGALAASQQSAEPELRANLEEGIGAFVVRAPSPSVAHRGQSVRVRYGLVEAARVDVSVRDLLGREHSRTREERPAGWHEVEVPLGGLGAGVYLVTVRAGARQRTVRFVVQ